MRLKLLLEKNLINKERLVLLLVFYRIKSVLAWDISPFASSGPAGDGIVLQCQLAVIIKKLVTQYLLLLLLLTIE